MADKPPAVSIVGRGPRRVAADLAVNGREKFPGRGPTLLVAAEPGKAAEGVAWGGGLAPAPTLDPFFNLIE
jgi:hypothetical protein